MVIDYDFGSLVSFMIREAFQKVETLDPNRTHRYYLECKLCGGCDISRENGIKPSIDAVKHNDTCTLAKYLTTLRALSLDKNYRINNHMEYVMTAYRTGWQRANHDWQKWLDEQIHNWDEIFDLNKIPKEPKDDYETS